MINSETFCGKKIWILFSQAYFYLWWLGGYPEEVLVISGRETEMVSSPPAVIRDGCLLEHNEYKNEKMTELAR